MIHENGIETAQVFLSDSLFHRALRAANEDQERELKRILANRYRGEVKPDPLDIISIDWEKAPPELQRAVNQDISVVATIEIARGNRILADYVSRYVDGGVRITRPPGQGNIVVRGDGGEIELKQESLRRHKWEDEDG